MRVGGDPQCRWGMTICRKDWLDAQMGWIIGCGRPWKAGAPGVPLRCPNLGMPGGGERDFVMPPKLKQRPFVHRRTPMTAETVRRWGGRLLLAGALTVAAVALAEVGLRLSTEPPAGLFTMTEREFERLPGIFQPGQSLELQQGTEFEHTVRIDSLGYRGTDFPRSRPADEVRIFSSGDSFTWGHNLDHGSTPPAQLEGRLSDRCGPSRVINAGLSGSTILAQEALITRGLARNRQFKGPFEGGGKVGRGFWLCKQPEIG